MELHKLNMDGMGRTAAWGGYEARCGEGNKCVSKKWCTCSLSRTSHLLNVVVPEGRSCPARRRESHRLVHKRDSEASLRQVLALGLGSLWQAPRGPALLPSNHLWIHNKMLDNSVRNNSLNKRVQFIMIYFKIGLIPIKINYKHLKIWFNFKRLF